MIEVFITESNDPASESMDLKGAKSNPLWRSNPSLPKIYWVITAESKIITTEDRTLISIESKLLR